MMDDIIIERVDILNCINHLNKLQKDIIMYRYFHNFTKKETAEILSLNVEKVRNEEDKALRNLRHPKYNLYSYI